MSKGIEKRAPKRKRQKPGAKGKRGAVSNVENSVPNANFQANGKFAPGNIYAFQPGQSGNPKGRPTTHDQLRELIQAICNEPDPDAPVVTRLELMLRAMLVSQSATDHSNILEHGFGKVPQDVNVRNLTDDELVRHAADLAATLGLGSGGTPAPPAEPPGESSGTGDPGKP